MEVNGNGFCFLEAVRTCLLIDYKEDIPVEKLIKKLMNELYERVNYYSNFHQGGIKKLLKDAKKFIKKRKYRLDVVDVCIAATANVLKFSLYFFEKINSKVQIIKHKCNCVDTDKTIYLCYSCTPNTKHLGDHYDGIVNIQMENTQENDVDSNATEVYTYKETQEERIEGNQENMPSASTSSHTKKKTKEKQTETCIPLKMFQYKMLMQYPGK